MADREGSNRSLKRRTSSQATQDTSQDSRTASGIRTRFVLHHCCHSLSNIFICRSQSKRGETQSVVDSSRESSLSTTVSGLSKRTAKKSSESSSQTTKSSSGHKKLKSNLVEQPSVPSTSTSTSSNSFKKRKTSNKETFQSSKTSKEETSSNRQRKTSSNNQTRVADGDSNKTGATVSSRRRSSRLTIRTSTSGASTQESKSSLPDNMDESDKNANPNVTSSANATPNPAASSSGTAAATGGEEGDDSEMGRLQALLESRGLPPHIFGALGPRVQHLLHRSMGPSGGSKGQQLLVGLQATGDEGQQLQAVMEMCQLLVMGNEDTLSGFPIKQAVPALVTLLRMEHNFDIMNHAVRALTYMMESLPRSSVVVVEAIPVFLEKLQVIQCMDVAEQSLTALEMLSRRHSKNILHAKGVSSCLTYIDFFSINAQRSALAITANCCQNLTREEFEFVKESIPILCNHLTAGDKKSCESTCLAFSRLVDSFPNETDLLTQIACPQLLPNLQQLLLVTPQVISTSTFVSVVRLLATLCAACPSLAVDLLKLQITETLRLLFLGPNSTDECLELSNRSPQEFYELTSLVAEMMPRLPKDGIFKVDSLLSRQPSYSIQAVWQYKDERGVWHSYDAADNKILEAAHSSGDEEVNLASIGHNFLVDFSSMTQVNEETGASRPVQRRTNLTGGKNSSRESDVTDSSDLRAEFLENEPQAVHDFVRSVFPVLFEVYSSSGGPTVKHKCLQALLRIVYFSPSSLLDSVLKNQGVSRHVAAMLASPDLKIVVGSLQMANILMQKLPDVFCTFFRREGVMHQMRKLILEDQEPEPLVKGEESTSTAIEASALMATSSCFEAMPSTSFGNLSFSSGSPSASSSPVMIPDQDKSNPGKVTRNKKGSSSRHLKTSSSTALKKRSETTTSTAEVKHIKTTKAPTISTRSHSDCDVGEGIDSPAALTAAYSLPSTSQGLSGSLLSAQSPSASSSCRARNSRLTTAASKTTSFLANLHPSRWGRWSGASAAASSLPSSSCSRPSTLSSLSHDHLTASSRNLCSVNREKVRLWIKEQAIEFESKYFSSPEEENSGSNDGHPSLNTLNQLTVAVESLNKKKVVHALEEIKSVLQGSDISPFELIHSKIVEKLLEFLTQTNGDTTREDRIRFFLHVFIGSPKTDSFKEIDKQFPLNLSTAPFSALVAKLNGCITQLEQFPVRVHDVIGTGTGSVRGTSALKFFNTHQLKCNLQRHPSVKNLKQWKGGDVKIDPLALVQAIERYLVIRGYGRIKDNDDEGSDDDNSDEEFDDNMTAMLLNQGQGRHKLQFFIGDNLLPYNMTVYQAIRQFTSHAASEGQETDLDCVGHLANANLWGQTHVIYYRPYSDTPLMSSSPSSGSRVTVTSKKSGKNSKQSPKRKDDLWTEGKVPLPVSPVDDFLTPCLPSSANITDSSADTIALLRVLNALNRFWGNFYSINRSYKPAISIQEFVNVKLTAKANRQLQDPLVIMTGNLPSWLSSLANVCPFLFPFETRHLLFYVTCFDRDRALQRLLDSTPGLNSNDSSERVTPRLDRRKKTVSREDLLRQAEVVLQDVSASKSLLEIQYENEVGTGLGPTLEFYALVSQELQRADLDIWRGEVSFAFFVCLMLLY